MKELHGKLIIDKVEGLPCDNAVQATEHYIDKTTGNHYLFCLQINNKKRQYISRYKIEGTVAFYLDKMVLNNCGHSQTLDVYDWNGKTYILVTCKPLESGEFLWARQIGRIEYEPNKTIESYKNINRLTNITDYRVECGLSADTNILLVYTKSLSGEKKITQYDFGQINELLDREKWIPIKYAKQINGGEVTSDILGYKKSLQGIDVANGGNTIYISGGSKGDAPEIKKLKRVTKDGENKNGYEVVDVCHLVHTNLYSSKGELKSTVECERLRIKGSNLEITLSDKSSDSPVQIYAIPKTFNSDIDVKDCAGITINIHGGHAKQGNPFSGACDKKLDMYESVEDRKVCREVIRQFIARGGIAHDCTVDGGAGATGILSDICAKSNSHKVDIDISIHFNSGRSDSFGDDKVGGTEVLLYDVPTDAKGNIIKKYFKQKHTVADKICLGMKELGFTNRNLKPRPNLYFLKHTKNPAILIEVCFVDDADDAKLYKEVGVEKIAQIIVDAIADTFK